MSKEIRPEVYRRVVLAKSLHRAGEASCARRNDQMFFTEGILLLHDAAEAALGAVADHLNAKFKGNCYLLNYYDLIEKEDNQSRKVPYRNQMKNLNTIRNNAKHSGILPNPKSDAHFPQTVYALIEEVCQTYLGLDFSSVSLKSLTINEKILSFINKAEKEIEQEKIEDALISLAYAMYHICEASTIPFATWLFKKEKAPVLFTQVYKIEHTVTLIERGVDPYLYHRFKNLTPMIGKHKDTGKLFHWWDKHYGHPANWTVSNVHFCLDFCIDTALKFQREEYEGYTLIRYNEVFEDIIKPANEEATIWNLSSHYPEFSFQKSLEPRSPVLILKKGQSIIGHAYDDVDSLDEWLLISKDILLKSKKRIGFGFVLKKDVKITRRKRHLLKKVNDS